MFRANTADRWHWSTDVGNGVDFCDWVLRADELRVPPFDRHPNGDGALRAAGLTAASWRPWLERVLDRNQRFQESVQGGAQPTRELGLSVHSAHPARPGDPAIGARLAALWPRYEARADAWKRLITGEARPTRPPVPDARRLWAQLEPFRSRLPPMHVYLVDYPRAVLSVVPPVSAIVGAGAGVLDRSAYAAAVLRAAESLAAYRAVGRRHTARSIR